ncbi:hypothetical protein ACVGXN_19800 [Enterobacter hormaechei]
MNNACLQPNEYEWPRNGIVKISSPHEGFRQRRWLSVPCQKLS